MGDQKICMLAVCGLLVVSLLAQIANAQTCSQTVSPMSYAAFPTLYNDVLVIHSGVDGCVSIRGGTEFQCDYSVVLGDGVMVPSPPDLDSSSYIRHFLAWQRGVAQSFVDFIFNGENITAIELSFLNSPANGFSLPDIPNIWIIIYGDDITKDVITVLPTIVIGNQDLAETDNQVKTVTILPTGGRSGFVITNNRLRLGFEFTEFHKFDWIFLSEVRFCADPQPNFQPSVITFQQPTTSIVEPTADDLMRGSIEFVCTVSGEGSYTWQWERDNSVIENSNPNYDITIANGERTTKLMISNLDFNDAGQYECTAQALGTTVTGTTVTGSVVREIQFPETITAPDMINGYFETGEVTLSCELHGYQSSVSPPVWLFMNGTEITTSDKYTITSDEGSNTIVLENGTVLPSEIVTLRINALMSADKGNYTCRGPTGLETVTQLTVVPGTAPPTTPSEGGTSDGTAGGAGDKSGVIAAAVIVTIIIVLTLIGILVVAGIFIYIKIRDDKINISPTPNGNSYIEVNPKRRLTREDIQWRLNTPSSTNDGSDTAHIYSMIDKSTRDHRDSSVPVVPPQNFNETDFVNMGFDQEEEPQYEDGELYNQPGLKAPRRRLTNTTKPKLAKITTVDPKAKLDSNPIYETTVISKSSKVNGTLDTNPLYAEPGDRNSFTTVSTVSGGEPLYSEALNPTHFVSSSSTGEPIYSVALNPTNFRPEQAGNADSDLLPYGPVYAQPATLTRVPKPFSVTADNIREREQLGVGQFGEVVLAETVGLSEKDLKLGSNTDKSDTVLVAVKKLKAQADSSMKESFEKEIKFMSGLSDDNIVRLLAVCDKDPKFIVIEYMENGDLYQYLNLHGLATSIETMQPNQLPVSILLYMAVQISSGMRYLASLKYVHRDLASRNCLVGNNYAVKISDFGMSRNLYESVYYRVRGRAMLPIRWMAMESFYGRFSEKTDVWSFGVVMWEIFTLGRHQPYEDMDDQEMIQDAVRNKERKLLVKPHACPDDVYSVMLRCWEYKLDDRATFAEIFDSLSKIHKRL